MAFSNWPLQGTWATYMQHITFHYLVGHIARYQNIFKTPILSQLLFVQWFLVKLDYKLCPTCMKPCQLCVASCFIQLVFKIKLFLGSTWKKCEIVIYQQLDDLCTHYWFFDKKNISIQISIEVLSSMHEAMSALHS